MTRKAYMMGMLLVLLAPVPALAVNPAGYGSAGGEFNIKISRVPANERKAAEATKSPFEATPEILAEGKEIFLGRGGCISCHGAEGKGDGAAAKNLPIQPRNFTNPKFNKYRTPGEMMWVLKNGSMGQTGRVPGTGMLPVVQPNGFISEADGWKVLLYERSLGETK
jgi:cytochrome c553